MASDHLTPKQEKFCQKYIELGNASEAYRQAYDAENMSPEAIHEEAYRLTIHPDVSLRIEDLRRLARKRHEVTADRVIAEYAKLAFLDIRKAFDEDGNLKPIHEMDDDTAAAIAGLEVEVKRVAGSSSDDLESQAHGGALKRTYADLSTRIHKIKLADKKGALDSLARHLGMFTDKTELSGPNGTPLPSAVIAVTPEAVKAIVQQVRDEF
ncbi:terminase small subunit [Fimbriiglobus ruber]|uniref:Phage terminase, small subunit n=1 Tax=Fimbriiglobus ruber TaxID=1908690 RepID=A0A225DT33_9BACT|nr:terminase small subunit [Fimbriiglobus ruber]OWK39535.1 Phage terminase, small subunit [Fimbriiglobus ruber]